MYHTSIMLDMVILIGYNAFNTFLNTPLGRVAQLDRVTASEAVGRGSESRLAHQLYKGLTVDSVGPFLLLLNMALSLALKLYFVNLTVIRPLTYSGNL